MNCGLAWISIWHACLDFGVQVCYRKLRSLYRFDITALMLPKTKYARSGDVRIAYQITGDGPFDVVWAPGSMSHLDLDWEIPQRALFVERFSNIGGIAVHAGPPIMPKAEPDRVVVSRTVKDLVPGSGINFQYTLASTS